MRAREFVSEIIRNDGYGSDADSDGYLEKPIKLTGTVSLVGNKNYRYVIKPGRVFIIKPTSRTEGIIVGLLGYNRPFLIPNTKVENWIIVSPEYRGQNLAVSLYKSLAVNNGWVIQSDSEHYDDGRKLWVKLWQDPLLQVWGFDSIEEPGSYEREEKQKIERWIQRVGGQLIRRSSKAWIWIFPVKISPNGSELMPVSRSPYASVYDNYSDKGPYEQGLIVWKR